MLTRLFIKNYAIIDEVEIDFSASLNIITGETGAGKSILIGALGLILGQRADASVLLSTEKKCLVEGTFLIDYNKQAKQFLTKNDFDIDSNLIIRREIAVNGKSRAFINDTPATLTQIKELASLMVNLHQQFDTLELGNDEFQRQVIDALANNEQPLHQYQQTYKDWQHTKGQLKELVSQKASFQKEAEYQQFLFDELNDAAFKENELEDMEAELKLLTNTESIKAALEGTYYQLKESETPIATTLKQLANTLNNFQDIHPAMKPLADRVQSVYIEINDIAAEATHLSNTLLHDASRIETINERLSLGYKLLKKHGVL
ncbi:MAG: AAA family ATPase, partial [Bacteroidota bacterium]